MNLKFPNPGDRIICNIDTRHSSITNKGIVKNILGRIQKEKGYIFICQDIVSSGTLGQQVKDKLGYKEAWYVNEGLDCDLRDWGVEILELPDNNENYGRIN